jgi:UDP-glucose 4-epimerase
MRILVTGGAGFIGSALTRCLISTKHEVVVVDNLSTGSKENVPDAAHFVFADLADGSALERIPDGGYDAVIHLAAQSSGMMSHKDPYADMNANVGSTLLLSRWCLEQSVPRFLYASSMTVYGEGNREPVPESAPCRPISYYAASKLASENYLHLAAHDGLSVACLRFYNVYGPGQNLANINQGMVSIYLAYLLKEVAVPVTGSLDRYRDFIHVADVVDSLTRALQTHESLFELFNIGTGIKTTVRALLAKLVAAMGLPDEHPIVELAGSASDVFGSVADIGHACEALGWKPRVALDEGIADMVGWARAVTSQ